MTTRGFTIVFSLLALTMLLVMGMALMGAQVAKYRGSLQAQLAAQALAMAQAGLEDARVKLNLDPNFFPRTGTGQAIFTYSETMADDNGQPLGGYFVTVDKNLAAPWIVTNPYMVIRIIAVGLVGPVDAPLAQRTLHAELDADPSRPRYWRFTGFQDDSSL